MIKKVRKFFGEVGVELRKVSWPTKQELVASTWVVISITFILTVYIGTVDYALSKLLQLMIK
ncbi:preprotein translocase subunit SecE [Candidatus Omnitrophota bacterium]